MSVFEALHHVHADPSFWLDGQFMNSDEAFGKDLVDAMNFSDNSIEIQRTVLADTNRHVEVQTGSNPIVFFANETTLGSFSTTMDPPLLNVCLSVIILLHCVFFFLNVRYS